MCKCQPLVRTPFCGKIGCTWPEQRTWSDDKRDPEKCETPACQEPTSVGAHGIRNDEIYDEYYCNECYVSRK